MWRDVLITYPTGNNRVQGELWLPSDDAAALRAIERSEVLNVRPGVLVKLDKDTHGKTPTGWHRVA